MKREKKPLDRRLATLFVKVYTLEQQAKAIALELDGSHKLAAESLQRRLGEAGTAAMVLSDYIRHGCPLDFDPVTGRPVEGLAADQAVRL